MLPAIIVYFQIFLGRILHLIASSEIKSARKYLVFTKNLLLILLALTLIYSTLNFKIILPFIIGFLIFKYFQKIYFLFGLATLISFYTQNSLPLLALTSLLVLIQTSLLSLKPKDFLIVSIYFILPFSLIFIETFINANLEIFIGLLVGGLIAQLNRT